MGTWDAGPFDNHAATELLDELRAGTFNFEALRGNSSSAYVEAEEAEVFVALGALSKLPAAQLPEGISSERLRGLFTPQSRAWLRKKIDQALSPELSGAMAMWEETGELERWVATARAAQP